MSVQSLRARISQGDENLVALFETVDAFLAVDQLEEAHAADLDSMNIFGTPLSLFTDSLANPIYPRWFMDTVMIWERYKDIIDFHCTHQEKSSIEPRGDRISSIDKEQISQDSEGNGDKEVDATNITSNAEETTTPGRNVSNEEERYDLDREDLGEEELLSGKQKNEQASDFSGPVASSCEACMLPDNKSMLMCENESVHKDSESWYHFICVGLSIETIPKGTWFCPPCQSKMLGKTEPSRLSPQKQKHPKESSRKRPGETGDKPTKAQPKSRKLEKKSQESPKESKQPISKKANEDTKKPGKSKISKNRWRDPIEEQKVAELVREYQNDPMVPEKDKYGETKWTAISAMLLERHGYVRTADSIKCKFARKIRKISNYDERSDKKKDPNRMQTSVESPESRKLKRQAKAEAIGEPSSMRKRARRRSSEVEEAREDISKANTDQGLAISNVPQEAFSSIVHEENFDGENNEIDGRNFERHLPPQFQQFDWTPNKNKGKRKRDENDDEQASERHAQMPRSC